MTEVRRCLPWEQSEGAANGVGVCLSGGGLRAASFALGVVQALQHDCGLLYGPNGAKYLSAVSGGSYIAATHAINARQLALDAMMQAGSQAQQNIGPASATLPLPPLAPGSPEEQYILDHGRYLITPFAKTAMRFVVLGVLNFTALVVLFIWAGTMLADAAVVADSYLTPDGLRAWLALQPVLLLVVGLVAAILLAIYGLYSESILWRYLFPIPALTIAAVLAGPTLNAMTTQSWLTPNLHWVMLLIAAVILLAATAATAWLLQKAGVTGLPAAAANWGQVVAVRIAGGILLIWSGVIWYPLLLPIFDSNATTDQITRAGLAFFASLVAGGIFSFVPDRASLHREYRNRIRSCFGIVRDGTSVVPVDPNLLLSQLYDKRRSTGKSPQLLICATANVPNVEGKASRRAYAPFVLTYDVCGVPGTQAQFDTAHLELGQASAGMLGGKEPLMTLFTAVATTGAAVSPSMGRLTLASARPILAALNLRLGRWLPNPFSDRMRNSVAKRTTPGRFERDRRMGLGYDELIPEMLGISGTRAYVSDGGHYDNLGLLALLRGRCAQIWCVDSTPDVGGTANELKRVLALAEAELGVTSNIDLGAFVADSAGLYGTTFVSGSVTYAVGVTADLHVIKLGLTAESPRRLKDYRDQDKGYPHHKTTRQWYSRARMEAYRDLGCDSTTRGIRLLNS